ncbi:MAG: hypothetical protein ABJD24_04065 [Acidimicrobiales bacterium]
MRQRVLVSASAVALVALAAGGAALALRGNDSHTPRTIMVQSSQGGAPAEAKLSADTASGTAMPYQNMNFVLSGDLPALDGDRPAFHFAANPTADPAAVAALAKTFGLDGDVKTVEGGWQVGDPSTGPGLFVNKAAGLPWYFSNYAELKGGYACASAGGVAPEGDVVDVTTTTVALPPECVPPPAPTGVPTKDEAFAKATDLLTTLGADTGALTITANASEWSADVQAVPSLDGIATPSLTMSVGFGGEGKVQYANGFLLAPEKADSYPRIGTAKAFDALKAGKGMTGWFAYGGPMMRNSVASGAPGPVTSAIAVSDSASGSETVCAADAPLDPTFDSAASPTTTMPVCSTAPAVECLAPTPPPSAVGDKGVATAYQACGPVECFGGPATTIPDTAPADVTAEPALAPACPEPLPPEVTTPPEPMTVTITGVHETLVPLMGADGSMWFLPGYEFTTGDGGTWPVLAIDESFVQQVAPTQPIPERATSVVGTVVDTPSLEATTAPNTGG